MKTIILISLVFLYGCSSEQASVSTPPLLESLPVTELTVGSATTYHEYPASVEGTVNVEIRSQVDGYLDKVFIDEGDYVHSGQSLFKINDLPFREQLNSSKASLHATEAAVINAQLEIDKLTPLVENKVVSEIQLKMAKAAYKLALANEEQAKANVATAQINLSYTLIKAPSNGYIGRLPKKRGSLVSRSEVEALTQLSDVHDVHVYFSLGEADFINFKAQYPGKTLKEKIQQLAPVSLLLADNTLYPQEGKVDVVDGQFDKNTGAITLRANFPNAQGLLRSGNTGKVKIGLLHSNAIIVPQAATIEIQDKVFVYAVGDSNKVKKQPINIIARSGTDYLVKDGVKAGDKIVLKGFENLKEGVAISPTKEAISISKK